MAEELIRGLMDAEGNRINPATEETQALLVAALAGVTEELGQERIVGSGASAQLTIPANTEQVTLVGSGGAWQVSLNDAAVATDFSVPDGVSFSAGVTSASKVYCYVPGGVTVSALYTRRIARS